MKSFGINWDFIKNLLGIKSEDVPVIEVTPVSTEKTTRQTYEALTRKEQILHSMNHAGSGTSRQIARRLGLSLSVTRTHLTALHRKGLIRDSGADVGHGIRTQNVWEVVD